MTFDRIAGHRDPTQPTHKVTSHDDCEIVPGVFPGPLLHISMTSLLLPSE